MKVAEIKQTIERYRADQLRRLVVEMYKAMPKGLKESHSIDDLISSPASKPKRPNPKPNLEVVAFETDQFIRNAYSQYYYIPNSVVPKRDRSQWRFTALRLFKQINHAAGDTENVAKSCELLERLYVMLCYSCRYELFSAYDPFQSVGIEQSDFFRAVLQLKRRNESPKGFVRNSILLALENGLNRYTLYESLMEQVVGCLETTDLKELAIAACDEIRESVLKDESSGPSKARSHEDRLIEFRRQEVLENLAKIGFMCHMALFEEDEAVEYFHRHYVRQDKEIALYVLLHLIEHYRKSGLWIKAYEGAVGAGVRPREDLKDRYIRIRECGTFPG